MAKIPQPVNTTARVYRCFTQAGVFSSTFRRTNFSSTSHAAKYSPQRRKFQLAPCHRPVQNHTIRIFRRVFAVPQRLPPRGIYRYSRNQPVRDMCHRRQNSVTEAER